MKREAACLRCGNIQIADAARPDANGNYTCVACRGTLLIRLEK